MRSDRLDTNRTASHSQPADGGKQTDNVGARRQTNNETAYGQMGDYTDGR